MWPITETQAIEMYARFWRARSGRTASATARARAKELNACGDHEGFKIWNEVATAIEKRDQADPPLH